VGEAVLQDEAHLHAAGLGVGGHASVERRLAVGAVAGHEDGAAGAGDERVRGRGEGPGEHEHHDGHEATLHGSFRTQRPGRSCGPGYVT
jgi:hypothetical protein